MLFQGLGQSQFSQGEITDSQVNQFIGKLEMYKNGGEEIQSEIEEENGLQTSIYNTLMLEYDIFLSEEEVKYYKVILIEKENQIKRLKDMQSKKNSKLMYAVENVKKLNKKIKDVSDGYRIMNQKRHQSEKIEESHRKQRLGCQERKNVLYQKYRQLQEKQGHFMTQIDQYESCQAQYTELHQQNQELKEEIQKISKRKKNVQGQNPHSQKEELKMEIKKLYERIKMAEKDQEKICKQYQSKKKKQKALTQQQNFLGQKNLQMNSLYSRISDLKEECKQRKWVKGEREKEYHELLAEENQFKKQLSQIQQPKVVPKRPQSKSSYVHNFKIIDSQADEELGRGKKQIRSSSKKHFSSDSQDQMDELIDRFQKIKSKSKHLN